MIPFQVFAFIFLCPGVIALGLHWYACHTCVLGRQIVLPDGARVIDISKARCAAMCLQRTCTGWIHHPDVGCVILGMDPSVIGDATHLFSCCAAPPINPTMVTAPGLSVRASSTFQHYDSSRAIDGNTETEYYSNSTEMAFIEVDLGEVYPIMKVRLLPRKVEAGTGRFKNISIRAGTTQVSGPDFSSCTELGFFPGPRPDPWDWVENHLSEPVNGRYVVVQRTATTKEHVLEINEFAVYVSLY